MIPANHKKAIPELERQSSLLSGPPAASVLQSEGSRHGRSDARHNNGRDVDSARPGIEGIYEFVVHTAPSHDSDGLQEKVMSNVYHHTPRKDFTTVRQFTKDVVHSAST